METILECLMHPSDWSHIPRITGQDGEQLYGQRQHRIGISQGVISQRRRIAAVEPGQWVDTAVREAIERLPRQLFELAQLRDDVTRRLSTRFKFLQHVRKARPLVRLPGALHGERLRELLNPSIAGCVEQPNASDKTFKLRTQERKRRGEVITRKQGP